MNTNDVPTEEQRRANPLYVLVLAYRQARDCLRRETCDLIATGETP